MRFKQVSHNVYYEMESAVKDQYIDFIERKIKREKQKQPLIFKVYSIADQVIKHYKSDFFVHDYNRLTIEKNNATRFLWAVYDCGSHLIVLDNDFKEEEKSARSWFEAVRENRGQKAEYYIIDFNSGSVEKIKLSQIKPDYFYNKLGDIKEYFNKIVVTLSTREYFDACKLFAVLMHDQRDYATKEQIDDILKAVQTMKKGAV